MSPNPWPLDIHNELTQAHCIKPDGRIHKYIKGKITVGFVVYKMDAWPSFARVFPVVKLFHCLQHSVLVELSSNCMNRWTMHWNIRSTRIGLNCVLF